MLEKACYVFQRSQTSIVNEALGDWLSTHQMSKRYQLSSTKEHTVLAEVDSEDFKVVEILLKNGVSLKQLAQKYSADLGVPVQIKEEK